LARQEQTVVVKVLDFGIAKLTELPDQHEVRVPELLAL
jgi:hypothetical protein